MYTTSFKIGACHHAHAQSESREKAIAKTIELSRKTVNWKEGATPSITIVSPNGKQYDMKVVIQ